MRNNVPEVSQNCARCGANGYANGVIYHYHDEPVILRDLLGLYVKTDGYFVVWVDTSGDEHYARLAPT